MNLNKRRATSAKQRLVRADAGAGYEVTAGSGPAFTIHAPVPERRQELLQARENDDILSALQRSAPIMGTAPGGETLGGSGSAEDAREARLNFFAEKKLLVPAKILRDEKPRGSQRDAAVEEQRLRQNTIAARAIVALHEARKSRARQRSIHGACSREQDQAATAGAEATIDADMRGELEDAVLLVLGMLGERLDGRGDVAACCSLLRTVLSNAATKGDDSGGKYLCLKGSNVRVRTGLLQHPEVVALLQLAGFQRQGAGAQACLYRSAQEQMSVLQVQVQEKLEGGG